MKCPVCSNTLVEYDAKSLHVDICRDGCSGIWLDGSELERCDEGAETFPNELLQLNRAPNVLIDRSKARNCPRCDGVTLTRNLLDPATRFEIDTCGQCGGTWLDVGELELLRRRSDEDAALDARLAGYEKKFEEQMKDVDSRRRISKLFKLLGAR